MTGKIRLNKTSLHLDVGQKRKLKVAGTKKKINMKKGSTKTLRLKGAKKAKWTVVSEKKVIRLKSKKSTSVKVVAKEKGTARIRCTAAGKKLTCTVKVGGKKVASDGASTQRNNPDKPTRVLKKGTKINMYFGNIMRFPYDHLTNA